MFTTAELIVILAALRNMQRDIDEGHWQQEDFVDLFDELDEDTQRHVIELNLDELCEKVNFAQAAPEEDNE